MSHEVTTTEVLWSSPERNRRAYSAIGLVSVVMAALGFEIVRSAVAVLAQGYGTPLFGFFPVREMGAPEAVMVGIIGGACFLFFLRKLALLVLVGLPCRLAVEGALFFVEYDGIRHLRREVEAMKLLEAQAIPRGLIAGFGKHVVYTGKFRFPLSVAILESQQDADALARVIRERASALFQDKN